MDRKVVIHKVCSTRKMNEEEESERHDATNDHNDSSTFNAWNDGSHDSTRATVYPLATIQRATEHCATRSPSSRATHAVEPVNST